MIPETILQSNLLDILFEHRNKAYGAYDLRTRYNLRLAKSFGVTVAVVLLLSIAWYIDLKEKFSGHSVPSTIPTIEVVLQPHDAVKPVEIKKIEPKQQTKQFAEVANTNIKIVPDNLADKQVHDVADLNDKVIGLMDKPGDAVGENDIPAPQSNGNGSQVAVQPEVAMIKTVETAPLLQADVMPEFPGGMAAFQKFMLKNLHQPELTEGEKIIVKVRFVVDADGTIKSIEVLQSGGELDEEVIRVVNKMPRWKPGMQSERFVPVYFQLPVTFVGME